jgi:cobalt-zinc-cadmium efflux system outer membrane protein
MHMKKHLFGVVFFLSGAAWAADPLVLDKVLLQARDHNPEIIAARQSWRVTERQVSPAGTWPDPTFTFIDERFPSGVDGVEPMKMKHYRVEQMIPFPGKLTSEARMKHHEALIAETAYRAKTLEILNEVRMRYFQLYLTDQKISLASQAVEVMKQALSSAQARLGSNQTSASDVFMAQTELRKMENELFQQQQQRLLIAIELNTLLNQPTDTVLEPPQAPSMEDLPVALSDFQHLARRNAPMYLTALHEINHSRAMLTHNRLQFMPDFGLMYEKETADAGPSGRQIGVSVSFPLWFSRPWNQVKEAKEHIRETEANSNAMENHVMNKVHSEYIGVTTHLTLARNYQSTLLPLSLSNLKITRQRYTAGDADFLRLLEAFRTWITMHNEYQEELYAYGENRARLGQWIGIDVSFAKKALEQETWFNEEDTHGHK